MTEHSIQISANNLQFQLENATLPRNNAQRTVPPVARNASDAKYPGREERLAAFEARDANLRTLEYHQFWHRREKYLKGNAGASMQDISTHLLRVRVFSVAFWKDCVLRIELIDGAESRSRGIQGQTHRLWTHHRRRIECRTTAAEEGAHKEGGINGRKETCAEESRAVESGWSCGAGGDWECHC